MGEIVNSHLGDEFSDPNGQFLGYSASDSADTDQIAKQKHVDIRSILGYGEGERVYISMLYLTAMYNMDTLNHRRVRDLEGTLDSFASEQWSQGVISKDPSRNNWPVLSVQCKVGEETTFYSILRK